MQFIKNIKFTFLGLVLSVLLPLITIIVVFMAIYNYNTAYNAILDGFTKKLLAISSVTSSFIDGDKHQTIAIAKKMSAFTYDNKFTTLYALSSNLGIYTINLEKGGAIALDGFNKNRLSNYIIYDITSNSDENLLYAVTYTKEILSLNLETKEIKVVKKLDFIADGIAYQNGIFYLMSSSNLYKFALNSEPLFLKKYSQNVLLDSLSILDGKLYGINKEEHTIFYIDTQTLKFYDNIAPKFPLEDGIVHHLGVSPEYFYTGANNLILYERNSSTSFQDDFARQYRDETSPLYQQYIKPMRDIKKSLNIFYLYTFNLLYGDSNGNCNYIIDVNEGSDYDPIGSYDDMKPKELTGAESVMLRNQTYVSGLRTWDKWGLLKVAYAGIKDKYGKVVAVTGTDIDVSIITQKTKEALIQSILIGVLALIMGILASYYIAMKIIRPIELLKASALKIAAGNYGDNILIHSPKELKELSIDFNQMSSELQSTVNANSEFNSTSLEKESLCNKRLSKLFEIKNRYIKIDGMLESKNLIGIIENGNHLYIYSIDEVFSSSLEAGKRRIIINDILQRFISADSISEFNKLFNPKKFLVIDTD
ncbi:MAG: HAMP domain-containing protein, partial [Sulfurovum sp.]